jgi:OmcA/MtrC family decaheme c-type cytochrome
MRIPPSVFAIGRYTLILAALAASIMLLNGDVNKNVFGVHDVARYADPKVIEYIQPGLTFTVVSAKIAADGTISVDYKIADPTGAALDVTGVQTPGTVSPRYLIAYIPKGKTQFASYIVSSSTTNGVTVGRAGGDTGGTLATVALGEYVYTYATKAPAGFDATVTHRVGIYGSRNLTVWNLGTSYADTYFDFVPNGSAVTATRDIVRTATCDKCHDQLAFHGGSRRSVGLCIICHQPQTGDANGNTADFPVMIHKIHMGSQLPSVIAGTPYKLGSTDWSTVVLPSDPRRCTFCHESTTGATQANNWYTNPNRAACGACHDDVNFATGLNHVNLPEPDDSQCATCHIKQGELPFDASIVGAHTVPASAPSVPGINFTLVKVDNGTAGQKPTVTFTVKDNSGNPIPMSTFSANSGSLSLTMAGPTSDYGYTDFGVATTPGYVTESVMTAAQCTSTGTCTYTFTHAVPAKATGTYAIGIEGRMSITLLKGTVIQQTAQYSGLNQVIYFSVDGTPVQKRRAVVALANCNGKCHSDLELHGSLRNNTEYCVICHNPSNTDFTTRPTATVTAYRSLPNQAINLALMVHKIHTGVNLASFNQTYIVIGHGGAVSDFSDVRYPAMSPTGSVHDTTNCSMCHTGGSEAVFPEGKNQVTDPEGLLNPAPATTSACTACHLKTSSFAHAVSQTDPKFGETCDVCHATGQAFDVDVVHAGK